MQVSNGSFAIEIAGIEVTYFIFFTLVQTGLGIGSKGGLRMHEGIIILGVFEVDVAAVLLGSPHVVRVVEECRLVVGLPHHVPLIAVLCGGHLVLNKIIFFNRV